MKKVELKIDNIIFLQDVIKLIDKESNDQTLGKKIRAMMSSDKYWKPKK